MNPIPETEEYKEQSPEQYKQDQEKLNQLVNKIGKVETKKMINKLGFITQQHWNKEDRQKYMNQLQRLYNVYGEVYGECPFTQRKLVLKK